MIFKLVSGYWHNIIQFLMKIGLIIKIIIMHLLCQCIVIIIINITQNFKTLYSLIVFNILLNSVRFYTENQRVNPIILLYIIIRIQTINLNKLSIIRNIIIYRHYRYLI